MRFAIASALVAASAVAAQTTHTIMVGAGGALTYEPSNITAAAGDIVSFQFMAKNHTTTQSTFAKPCEQLVNSTVTPNIIGISSGYMPVPANSTSFPSWSIQVQDTTPLWFFCLQGNHCQQGMVFSINATPQKSFDAYLSAAKASTQSVAAPQTGGSQTPPSGGTEGGSSGTTGTSTSEGGAAGAGVVTAGSGSGTGTGSNAASTSNSASRLPSGSAPFLVSVLAVAFGVTL